MQKTGLDFLSGTWHVAILAALLSVASSVGLESPTFAYFLALVASSAFLSGLAWLAMRVRVHEPFRDPERFKWNAGAAGVLTATGLFLPRAYYQWGRYENDSPMPEWAFGAGSSLAAAIGLALLMLAVWLALAALVRQRAAPNGVEVVAALLIAFGGWLFLLGAIVYRTDHTSEGILQFTLPVGLAAAGTGTALLVAADFWRRMGPARPFPEADQSGIE